jgi:hypothetical protein
MSALSEVEAREVVRQRRAGELTSAGSALLLLAIMFALKWYGVVGIAHGTEGSGVSSAENAWQALTGLRWLMLLTIFVALTAVILHISQRRHGAQTNTGALVAALGTITAAFLVNRVLIDLPSPDAVVDVKLGGFVGLICAIGIALGGYESSREEIARIDRIQEARAAEIPLPSRTPAR